MRFHDGTTIKRELLAGFHRVVGAPKDGLADALATIYAPNTSYIGAHPINQLHGTEDIADKVWRPLHKSLRGLWRQDDILIGAHFQNNDWVSATGYLHGTFVEPLFSIPATGNWVSLRYGEFHRLANDKISASFVLFDFVDLMRQAGVSPWRKGAGVETLMPGPRTRDGVVLTPQGQAETRKTIDLVESMIFDGLLLFDGTDSGNMHMERYWTPDMMWYGPGMIGATMGLPEFFRYHQDPWQVAFPLRGAMPTRETKHIARFADGPYACITGWPSIYATHSGPFLGVEATDKPVDIRVMDWWHRSGDLLDENWIFIDMPHLFLQLGIDLFDRMAKGVDPL